MKPYISIRGISIWAMILAFAQTSAGTPRVAGHDLSSADQAKAQAAYGRLALTFEANQGQVDKKVKFLSRGSNYSLFLTSTEAVLQLTTADGKPPSEKDKSSDREARIRNSPSSVLRMKLVGSNSEPEIEGVNQLPSKTNYFTASHRENWRTGVPNYAKVRYKNVYPGIDLIYYGNQRQLEYDFVVAPGADPKVIALSFEGAAGRTRGRTALRIDESGDLLLEPATAGLRQHKPVVYQEVNGIRRHIRGRYVLNGKQVGFDLGNYDRSKPLVIDPVLSYSTSGLGGTAIAVDGSGNAYVTGTVFSPGFGTPGAFQETVRGSCGNSANQPQACYPDVFVAKLNPSGTQLIYFTYLGGDGYEQVGGIAVDHAGNAYLTGSTSSANFPITDNALQPIHHPCNTQPQLCSTAFVTKLNPSGTELLYSTYLGGSGSDYGRAIALDSTGNAYITGNTTSGNFPAVSTSLQPTPVGSSCDEQPCGDVFVTKLNASGTELLYSTYLGGSGQEWAASIAVDLAGNAYVTGNTSSTDFPTTAKVYSDESAAYSFVSKLDSAGAALLYSTRLSGGISDVAVDPAGNAYMTGHAYAGFLSTPGAFQTTCRGGDAFVMKLDTVDKALVYATCLGGSYYDEAYAIAVDSLGNAYVTGSTESVDFPITSGASQRSCPGISCGRFGFVTKLNAVGTALIYSTHVGEGSAGFDIAVDSAGNAYVTGWCYSCTLPTTPNAFRLDTSNNYHFMAKLFDELSLFVPLVLSFSGADNTFFTSELTLTNRAARDVTLNFTYTAIVGEGSGTASDRLAAGRQRIIPDGIKYLRSLGIPIPASGNHAGSLMVRFSGLSSEGAVLVRTTTSVPDGRAGFSYAGIPTSTTLSGPSYVCGLRQNATDRTNLAIHNTGTASEGTITLRLTLFSGDPAAPTSYTLPDQTLFPGGFYQINNVLQSHGLSLNSGYMRVDRVRGTAPYYTYALIHDQVNADGVFVPPIAESSLRGSKALTLPVVVENSIFSSELVLTNWSTSKKSVHLAFMDQESQSHDSSSSFVIELKAREQMILPSLGRWLQAGRISDMVFDNKPYMGSLFATVKEGDVDGVFLGVRISRRGQLGRYSLFYAAVPEDMASTASCWLYGLQQNAETRTNLALLNTGDADSAPDVFTVDLFDGKSGLKLTTIEGITLNARSWMQFESLLAQYTIGITQAYARVTRTSGSNAFIAYAVVSEGGRPAEGSGDASFVPSSP